MKYAAGLVVSLVLIFLGSPLSGLEDLTVPNPEGRTSESTTLSFMNQAVQVEPLQCAKSTALPDLSMTARECAETCGGCCDCRQWSHVFSKCIDWQCC